jgi:hypothetical protein
VASALSLAVIGADFLAAAAETFAIVLAAARVFFRRRARSLPAAVVVAAFASPFAIIQPAAKMDIGFCNRLPGGRLAVPFLSAAQHCTRGQATKSRRRELVKIASVQVSFHGY